MDNPRRKLVTHTFKGSRFDDHGVDVDCLPELMIYKRLLIETAKELWRRENPERRRIPKNFEDSLVLKFYEVCCGSSAIPIVRVFETPEQALPFEPPLDELDEAVGLLADASDAASHDRPLPAAFPKSVLPLFSEYGKSLRPDESIEHHIPGRRFPGRYTPEARQRLSQWTQGVYEDAIDLIGTVTMARVSRPRMAILTENGREVEAAFNPEDEGLITTALKDHMTAKIRVVGRGQFSAGGQIQKIVHVDHVALLPTGEIPFDPTAKPIWEVIDEIMKDVPDEEFLKLPVDAAENLDHYLYGAPKKKP